jgi:hypothetical protein
MVAASSASAAAAAAAAAAAGGLVGFPTAARAASQARVKVQPGLEYLEPIYELELSIGALEQGLEKGGKESWPSIGERLDKFFGGGLFSERNFYGGLGVQYTNQIAYEDAELPEYIRLDKEARFGAMEDALNGLEGVKNALLASDEEAVRSSMADARSGISRWFAFVPEADRDAVAELYQKARQADANRDGKLDDAELSTLDEVNRARWKRRIQIVGG